MCGIAGELRFDGTKPDLGLLQKMLTVLARRGPDASGQFEDGPVVLGHRRLAIIDLSEKANQPFIDKELGLVIVFNGTIYNYQALREELEALGYGFKTTSDTEVLLKAYHAWREKALERFIGMFAFAIWHIEEQKLFLARDPFGIKPLYYALDNKRFYFASSLPALLQDKTIDKNIDVYSLHHQLTLHGVVPAPRTILEGVRKAIPGYFIEINSKGKIKKEPYFYLNAERKEKYSEKEYLLELESRLEKAVERRLLAADVPVGILLSGGLDSSLLVGLLAKYQPQQTIKTFSIGFEDQPEEKGNEFEFSDLVAKYFNTDHQKIIINNNDLLPRLPEAVSQMAEPMVGQDAIAFYLLAEQVSKHVKVIQSGQGADEVFAGYFWYPQMHASKEIDVVKRFSQYYFDRDHQEYLETVMDNYYIDDVTYELVEKRLTLPHAEEFIDQVLRFDVTTLIVDDPVKRVDNMTMAWGLEARVPFLDKQVVEWAFKMPPDLKLRENGKYALKKIARGLLPDAIIDRPKAYFPVPALKYVRGDFYNFMRDILLSDKAKQRGIFNYDYINKLLNKPEDYFTRLQGSKLWHSALLELWLQQIVDN